MSNFRHPPEKKSVQWTPSPPLVSYGDGEISLLQHLNSLENQRFNLKAYAQINKIPRSSIYNFLKKLISTGNVYKVLTGDFRISSKGQEFLLNFEGVSNNSRWVCPTSLSSHHQKFTLVISSRANFSELLLSKLNPIRFKKVDLPNLSIIYIYLSNATILLKPKTVELFINETLSEDTDEGFLESFAVALQHFEKLSAIGILGDQIKLSEAHFARLQTPLAELLQKIDSKYQLSLPDGRKFWIDYSLGKLEEETNSPEARERIDQFLLSVIKSEANLTDLDKMKEILGIILKLQLSEIVPILAQLPHDLKDKANYFG